MVEEYLTKLAEKYGGHIIGGLIGAVVHRLRNMMSFRSFLAVLFISAFIGFCVGVVAKTYLKASDEIVFVLCSVSGVFSKDILDEIEEIIHFISEFVKKKLKLKDESEV